MSNRILKERHGVTRALAVSLGMTFQAPGEAAIIRSITGESEGNMQRTKKPSRIDIVRENLAATGGDIDKLFAIVRKAYPKIQRKAIYNLKSMATKGQSAAAPTPAPKAPAHDRATAAPKAPFAERLAALGIKLGECVSEFQELAIEATSFVEDAEVFREARDIFERSRRK